MAQRESSFLNMTLTLTLVALIAASILGFVHDLTKADIQAAKDKAQREAITSVLPPFETLGDAWKSLPVDGADSLEFFPAYDANKQLVGVAVKTYTKNGFSGLISIMAGIAADGSISGYEVLEHKETPGLGSKMNLWFKDTAKPAQNIIGKNPETTKFEVSKDGGEVDAITASTITSRAFLEAIKRAVNTYNESTPSQQIEAVGELVKKGGSRS